MTYKACCEPATFSPDFNSLDVNLVPPGNTLDKQDESIESNQINNFKIYPNPTTGNIQLAHYFQEITPANIYLLNAVGQRVQVLLSNETIPQGEFSQSFALNGLPAGIYYCVLETQKERKVQKLVLSK